MIKDKIRLELTLEGLQNLSNAGFTIVESSLRTLNPFPLQEVNAIMSPQGPTCILPTLNETSKITLDYNSDHQKLNPFCLEYIRINNSIIDLGFRHSDKKYDAYSIYPHRKLVSEDMLHPNKGTSELLLDLILKSSYRFKFDSDKRIFTIA